jgi:hypothetical protein
MSEVGEITRTVFDNIWRLFVETKMPGLNVSFAAFLVAMILVQVSIKLFCLVSGLGGGGGTGYGKPSQAPRRGRNNEGGTL